MINLDTLPGRPQAVAAQPNNFQYGQIPPVQEPLQAPTPAAQAVPSALRNPYMPPAPQPDPAPAVKPKRESVMPAPLTEEQTGGRSIREVTQTVANGFTMVPQTGKEAMELATILSRSLLVPEAVRTTTTVDHTADVFLLLSLGTQYGMTPAQALQGLYVINGRVSMYVATKRAMCYPYGDFDVMLDMSNPQEPKAVAKGVRFDRPQFEKQAVYSCWDAQLRGKMVQDANGMWQGKGGTWAQNWPDMLQARALGRLLDKLFPDIVGGFAGAEELEDIKDASYTVVDESKTTAASRVRKAISDKRKAAKVLTHQAETAQPQAEQPKTSAEQAQPDAELSKELRQQISEQTVKIKNPTEMRKLRVAVIDDSRLTYDDRAALITRIDTLTADMEREINEGFNEITGGNPERIAPQPDDCPF